LYREGYGREEDMNKAGINVVSRGKILGPAGPGRRKDGLVKFFLDKRDGRGYSPRFLPGGPVPRG
jgi:hypothetical protein